MEPSLLEPRRAEPTVGEHAVGTDEIVKADLFDRRIPPGVSGFGGSDELSRKRALCPHPEGATVTSGSPCCTALSVAMS